ncbi:drug/metabolite transporter (DMT)-like permease [Agrobacterium fabrum]|nr:drug/metabolite transporter (DMT)-like permease [Agrobacterium fabrum]
MAIQKQMDAREWAMLIALSLLWGGSFFFIGVAVKELPPVTIVTLRVSLAAMALLVVCRIMGLRLPREWTVWRAFFGMGLLNNIIPFCLIVWGQTHIASGLASILNATTPLFTVIVAHFLTADEKMTGNKLAGVLIGFAGVATMIGPTAFGGSSGLWGQIAILGAAISYSFAGIFGRRFKAMGVPPLMTATGQISSSTLMLIPARTPHRQTLDTRHARPWHLGSADRHRPAIDSACLSHLLPHSCQRRRHQPCPCHLPHTGQRHFTWLAHSRRAAGNQTLRGHGDDRRRTGRHRWKVTGKTSKPAAQRARLTGTRGKSILRA